MFVCYSHADKDLVYPKLARLRDAGINLWCDQGIRPGLEWSDAIAHRIERSAAYPYFVTPRSVLSVHCRREVSFALERPGRMLAVALVPTDLPSGLRRMVNNLQVILRYDAASANYPARLLKAVESNAQADAETATRASVGEVRQREPAPLSLAGRTAVAVIPFRLRNGAPEDQFLSVALADAVLHRLSSVAELIGRPISSVLRYKDADSDWTQIARDLEVEVVVHGVVQMARKRWPIPPCRVNAA